MHKRGALAPAIRIFTKNKYGRTIDFQQKVFYNEFTSILVARTKAKVRRQVMKFLNEDELLEALNSKQITQKDFELAKDVCSELIEEIQKLNDIYKEVLELKYVAQFSNQEITDFLHIEKKTVEMRLYRANNILRERLRDWYYEN